MTTSPGPISFVLLLLLLLLFCISWRALSECLLQHADSDGQSPGGPLKRPSAAGGPLKRPSAAVTVAKSKATPAARKASPMPVIKKRPATKTKGIKLGCGRCRGSQLGCLSCRDPEFTGKRWQK